jgi:DNA-binding XRE family transcriptional regulator
MTEKQKTKLRVILIEKKLNYKQLAEKAGMKPNTLYLKIRGKYKFSIDEAEQLSNVLGLDLQTRHDIFYAQ